MNNLLKCDKCGQVIKGNENNIFGLSLSGLPKGWQKTDCGELCPRCLPIYEKFMAEAREKFQKAK